MMNWKGCETKRSWPKLRYYLDIFVEGLRKTTRNPSYDNRSPGQYLNLGSPKYEAGVSTDRPRRSVIARNL
jgi:hypothetical protein